MQTKTPTWKLRQFMSRYTAGAQEALGESRRGKDVAEDNL